MPDEHGLPDINDQEIILIRFPDSSLVRQAKALDRNSHRLRSRFLECCFSDPSESFFNAFSSLRARANLVQSPFTKSLFVRRRQLPLIRQIRLVQCYNRRNLAERAFDLRVNLDHTIECIATRSINDVNHPVRAADITRI